LGQDFLQQPCLKLTIQLQSLGLETRADGEDSKKPMDLPPDSENMQMIAKTAMLCQQISMMTLQEISHALETMLLFRKWFVVTI